MTYMHNRHGSVLLMAIGMLTILAILASTFVIISNLDSQETESLALRACAEPITDGVVARAIAQIGADRAASELDGAYGDVAPGSNGWIRFIDCSHSSYGDSADFPNPEQADPWLATSYLGGEGVGGHFTNIDANTSKEEYNFDGIRFSENGTYVDGMSHDGKHVDTDGDGIPDATLYNTQIPSPITDANTYWAAMRIVDLSARICVNTAGGWFEGDAPDNRPNGSGPAMIDLRGFLDYRIGMGTAIPLYDMVHEGTAGSGTVIKGRIGNEAASGGNALEPAPGSLKGYDKYCGRKLLSPARGGYQPYGIGDEAFFLNACSYTDNISMFGGRFNEMLAPISTVGAAMSDQVRRQLTTLSSVSAAVREPSEGFYELLPIDTVQSQNDCQLVYERMLVMLERTRIGITPADRDRMAAHFAANLWAYCAYGDTGAPWAFRPNGDETRTFYGLRQDLVITQIFARHISNTEFDANDTDHAKDNSAWGFAVELANPTSSNAMLDNYELELKSQDGNTVLVPLRSGAGGLPFIMAPRSSATAPSKRVIYGCVFGAGNEDKTVKNLFGASPSPLSWYKDDKLTFLKGTPSISITLYRKVGTFRVPIDFATVGEENADLAYDTSLRPVDIAGDYSDPGWKPSYGDAGIHIQRDDRLKEGTARRAKFNMAIYHVNNSVTDTKLGQGNNLADGDLDHCIYATSTEANYSPGIYRPRDNALTASQTPTARESMPDDEYFLPGLADMANVYLTGPVSESGVDKVFTTEILKEDHSTVFKDRPDRGRTPTLKAALTDMVDSGATGNYLDVPPGYLFHEFFTRTPSHQARLNEKKRVYGLININTLGISTNGANVRSAAWWLPWPTESPSGSAASNSGNRLALGGNAIEYNRATAISYIQQYRDKEGSGEDRAGWTEIENLRTADGSDIAGFLTPGEVGIPLAKYMQSILGDSEDKYQDADYVRAVNALFGYISDCISTRSDVFACYVTVQHGKVPQGKRWRYVAVIDRSNVLRPTDKPALLMRTPIR